MESILSVSDLRVEVDHAVVIEHLSFELKAGQTLVVLGPNGAGKTMLLKALLGLLDFQGRIRWRPGIRMGYVPQRVPLNKDLPVTIGDFFSLKGIAPRDASECLGQVGIPGEAFLRKQLGVVSSGQFQRVLIAWALAKDPDVLLFDEPTAGIDVGGQETIHELLQRTRRRRSLTVVKVTHDLSTVYSEADFVLCMNLGRYCYGPPDEVLDPKALREIYGREIRFFRHSPVRHSHE